MFHWRSLEPITKTTYQVDLSEFLKIVSLTYEEHDYTVQDIIRTASHVLGGVHLEEPKNKKQKAFVDLDKVIPIFPDSAYRAIHSICTVSLKAMEPLENKIRAK